jgi:hypothetical protein
VSGEGQVEPDAVVAKVDVDSMPAGLDLDLAGHAVDRHIWAPSTVDLCRVVTGRRPVHAEGMHADDSADRFIDLALHRPHPAAISRGPVDSFTRIE